MTSGGSTWIRHLTQNLGVNLAGIRILFELEERLGMRILEQLYSERHSVDRSTDVAPDVPIDGPEGSLGQTDPQHTR